MTNGYLVIDFGGKTIDETGFNDPSIYAKIVNTNKPVMITNGKTLSDSNVLDIVPSFVATMLDKSNDYITIIAGSLTIIAEKTGHIYTA